MKMGGQINVAGTTTRHYYHPLARWIIGPLSVFCVVGGLSVALANGHGPNHLSTAGWALIRTVGGLSALFGGYLHVRTWRAVGVLATASGIRACRGFRSWFVPWSEITLFRTRYPNAFSPTVYAELSSGQLVSTTLTQGRKVRWSPGGATRDAVGALNAELEAAQSMTRLPSSL
jgi:hypothetical protein